MSPGQESTGCRHLAPSSQKRHCTTIHLTTHSLDNLYKILKNINNLKEIFFWQILSYSKCLAQNSLITFLQNLFGYWISLLHTHPYQVEGNTALTTSLGDGMKIGWKSFFSRSFILEISFPHLGVFLDLFFTGTDLGNLPILHRVTRKTRQKEHAGHGNIDFSPKSSSMCTKISQHWKDIMSARKVCYQPDIQCPA